MCKQVLRYHLARLLKSNWDTEADRLQQITIGFCTHRDIYTPFLVTENCFQINNGAVLSILGTEQYLMLFCEDSQFSKAVAASFRLLTKTVPVCVNDCSSAEKLINSVFRLHGLSLDRYAYGYSPDCYCGAIWVQRDLASPALACDAISDAPNADHLDAVWKFQRHSLAQTHIPINWSHFDPTLFPLAIQILNPHRFQKNTSLFAQVLQEVLVPAPGYDRNDIWIPFDIEERKKKFPKAFKELKIYMDYIEHNDIK